MIEYRRKLVTGFIFQKNINTHILRGINVTLHPRPITQIIRIY